MNTVPPNKKKTKSSQYHTIRMGLHKGKKAYVLTKEVPKNGTILVELEDLSQIFIHQSLLY